ncbi:MAG: hypothetical protein QG637_1021, partial [Chloroflexota bacterium]|nr:hypothetical protein [Chloroflexota bacterium]
MNRNPSVEAEDPIDLLAHSIPRNLWVTIITVVAMLLAGWLFFKPPQTPAAAFAQPAVSGALEGRIIAVLAEEQMLIAEQAQPVQRILVEITSGERRGERVELMHGQTGMLTDATRVRGGERVLLESSLGPAGERLYISDFVRFPALLGLAALFVVAVIAVGRWVGLRALASMGVSVLAIAGFIIPGIMAGNDPLLICTVGALLLMMASLYLVYGWTWKTHAALAGLTISLAATALLAVLFADLGRLAGLGSEEAGFLVRLGQFKINLRGVLLGGIVVGAVGVLDDVAVGQASATFELIRANPQLRWAQLFGHSMVIGRDHIASLTNTLLLAYVGASLPLFLLMAGLNISLAQTLNREFIAEEIVRTLVG